VPDLLARGRLAGWLLVAPALAIVLVILVYPTIGVVLRSFDGAGALSYTHPKFTLANYRAISADPAARIILRNTFVIAAYAAVLAAAVAYPAAAFISRLSPHRARVLLLLTLFPLWTSVLVRVYAHMLILGRLGLLFTETAVILSMASYLVPYLILIFYSGMVRIDDGLLRAARTLGAGPTQAVRYVFIPLSRPAVWAGTLLAFVIGLGFFVTPALLGGPSDITVAMYIQQQVNIESWGVASAMGVGLLVIALVAYIVLDRFFGVKRLVGSGTRDQLQRRAVDRLPATRRTRAFRVGLGIWTIGVFAFLLLPLVYVVVVSFSAKSYLTLPPTSFSLKWYRALFDDPSWRQSAWLSLRIALMTTVLATGSGLLAALALTRTRIRGKGALNALFVLPVIVPAILIAAGVFDFENRLYLTGTVQGFALGHTVLALPFTVLICTAALQQVGSSLDEAARSLGANRVKAFVYITLPLILPSVAAAAAIAFVTSWDETVISLFLQVIDRPLPVAIYQFMQQSPVPTVAALSTLIIGGVLVGGVVFLIGSRLSAARRSANRGYLSTQATLSSSLAAE
jgi:putative spermidine/putrescine transport system permease protein